MIISGKIFVSKAISFVTAYNTLALSGAHGLGVSSGQKPNMRASRECFNRDCRWLNLIMGATGVF